MKIANITLERASAGELLRLAGYGAAGFFAAGCCLEGRAPLAAGLVAACRPGKNGMAALGGGIVGSLVFLPFAPALRCCGILILIYTVLSAFRDTKWFRQGWFRPAAAAGATLSVELAYALQMGLGSASLMRTAACTALSGVLCHYCALLLRESVIPPAESTPGSGQPAPAPAAERRGAARAGGELLIVSPAQEGGKSRRGV